MDGNRRADILNREPLIELKFAEFRPAILIQKEFSISTKNPSLPLEVVAHELALPIFCQSILIGR